MPLTEQQIERLREAIDGYNFPAVYFDFDNSVPVDAQTMENVEATIKNQLRSADAMIVRYGLANVLYWGYAQIGYRDKRVKDFMNKVTCQQINNFQSILNGNNVPSIIQVKNIRMPQYSGMSFISKILMFLDPQDYCVLDKQVANLRTPNSPKLLNNLDFKHNNTQIRITNHNQGVYNGWRNECLNISEQYYQGNYRVVDIERGFFSLIQRDHLLDAQRIYNDA